ncbi:MAG: PAS domain S-box protein [Mariprofundaceae bacterium]
MSIETKQHIASLRFSELEKKALHLINDRGDSDQKEEIRDTKNLIHQLQVYQAELEIQNDELRESQEAVQTSKDRLLHLYHQAPVGYVSLDQSGIIREVNQRLAIMLNLTVDVLLNQPMINFIHPKDRDIFLGRFRAIYHSPQDKSMEVRLDCKDHHVCYALLEASISIDNQHQNGDGALMLLTINDITARRDAEANLRLADKIIHSAQESILVTNKYGKIINVNPRFEEITGYLKNEVLGKNPSILQSGRQDKKFYHAMWNKLIDAGVWQGVVWNKRKNGEEYAEKLTINAIYGEQYKEVTHFVGVFTDITDQLELEEKLRQSQKMEAIGILVGGIAHDFNNMLAGIVGNIYLAKTKTKALPEVTEYLDRIDHLSIDAAKMINQMLTFARKGVVQMEPLALNKSFASILDAVGRVTVPENIKLEFDMGNTTLMVEADATQLQQVMINLLGNARDALKDKKNANIIIELESYEVDEAFLVKHHPSTTTNFAHLFISDNGSGISKEDMQHIFEPFFTTKGVGEGTGLGLAMVYGAIKTHGGILDIESTPRVGTTVHVYLPLIEIETQPEPVKTDLLISDAKETILIVDDNEVVREIAAKMLESNGYQTHQACDGVEALKLFESHFNEIDLVILDIVMPGMSGGEVATKTRNICPDIPILFMTGYDKEHVYGEYGKLDKCGIITKPFQFELLSKTLRKLLNSQ